MKAVREQLLTRFVGSLSALAAIVLVVTGLAPSPAAAVPFTARHVVETLTVASTQTAPAYDRSLFGGWIDADGNGCNTRFEVLIRDAQTPTSRVPGTCYLEGGSWQSAYDAHVAEDPTGIEIDHVVAVAEAWRSGAWSWTDAERREFYNDLGVDYALVPSSTSANQSKSDKDPSRWVPQDETLVCDYVTDWVLIKYR